MAINQSVFDAISDLEELIQTRWIKRALIMCSNEEQCNVAYKILTNLDYTVEMIKMEDIDNERGCYATSIYRLQHSLSRVLVTTEDVFKKIQKLENNSLIFDVIL
jgi:superfamily II DNA/RNA helicase